MACLYMHMHCTLSYPIIPCHILHSRLQVDDREAMKSAAKERRGSGGGGWRGMDVCPLCEEAGGFAVVPPGCSCRGSAIGVHMACTIKAAAEAEASTEDVDAWIYCS